MRTPFAISVYGEILSSSLAPELTYQISNFTLKYHDLNVQQPYTTIMTILMGIEAWLDFLSRIADLSPFPNSLFHSSCPMDWQGPQIPGFRPSVEKYFVANHPHSKTRTFTMKDLTAQLFLLSRSTTLKPKFYCKGYHTRFIVLRRDGNTIQLSICHGQSAHEVQRETISP